MADSKAESVERNVPHSDEKIKKKVEALSEESDNDHDSSSSSSSPASSSSSSSSSNDEENELKSKMNIEGKVDKRSQHDKHSDNQKRSRKDAKIHLKDEKIEEKRRRRDHSSSDEERHFSKNRLTRELSEKDRHERNRTEKSHHSKGAQLKEREYRADDRMYSNKDSIRYKERNERKEKNEKVHTDIDRFNQGKRSRERRKRSQSPKHERDSRRNERKSRYNKNRDCDKDDQKDRREEGRQKVDERESIGEREGIRGRRSAENEGRRENRVREWDKGKLSNDERVEDRYKRNDDDDYDDDGDDGDDNDKSGSTHNKAAAEQEKEEPNFGLSGKLTEFTNTYKGVVIKYNEPPEARQPKTKWRLYPFKGDESLPILYIHRQSAFLLGRNRMIADIPIDHPSCSSQHAVIQFRLGNYVKSDGSMGKRVKPYVIDLESSNGTFVNNNKIEARRYVELKEKDMLKFGFSSREYVILHDKSKEEHPDDE